MHRQRLGTLRLLGTLQQRLGSLQQHRGMHLQRQGRHWQHLGRLQLAGLGQQSLAGQQGWQTLAEQQELRSQAVLGKHQSLQLQVLVLLRRRQSQGKRRGSLLALLLLLRGLWLKAWQHAVWWGVLGLGLAGHLGLG